MMKSRRDHSGSISPDDIKSKGAVRLTVDSADGLVLVVADPGGHLLLHPKEARRMAKLLRTACRSARKLRDRRYRKKPR